MADLTPTDVLEAVGGWSLLQINEFVDSFCEKFGVDASAPVAVAAGPAAGGAEAAVEQTEFDVILTGAGAAKIKVIKEVRSLNPSLGLKEAKEVVDSVPSELAKGVSKEEAEEIKKKILEVGGEVEVK